MGRLWHENEVSSCLNDTRTRGGEGDGMKQVVLVMVKVFKQ